MKCPFGAKPENVCHNSECVFSSVVNQSNCYYGERIDLTNISYHKGMTVKQLKTHLTSVDEKVRHSIKLLKYAEFCTDDKPNEQDEILYNSLRNTPPYNTRLFNFVTLRRFARMNRQEAFEAFQRSGVTIEESRLEFLDKPMMDLAHVQFKLTQTKDR
jgi:hypothetical protein